MRNILFPCNTQVGRLKKLWGFDIETYGRYNKFLMCSIVGDDDIKKIFWDKYMFIEFLKENISIFRHGYITATNLGFDLMGVITETELFDKFFPVIRGSSMVYVKIPIDKYRKLRFIDTMNFLPFSVEKWGNILKIPKLEKPRCFKRKPATQEEIEELERYNLQDSFITYSAIKFLQSGFYNIGAKLKITVASTALDLYKRRFLNQPLLQPDIDILRYSYNAYYGGRTEIIKRGYVKNLNYYDVNSLYPSVMLNDYPDPNSLFMIDNPKRQDIFDYEGIADVKVISPESYIPYLPYRYVDKNKQKKLIFPTGIFRGYYTFFELRRAVLLGYRIKEIYSAIGYSKKDFFFKDYVTTLYKKRQEYYGTPIELLYKLCLNSLYGKFGQKIDDKQEIIHLNNVTMDMINNAKDFFQSGDFLVFNKKANRISSFINPIFSIYTTAYARDVLYNLMQKDVSSIYYYDTDSLITSKEYDISMKLGELKKEFDIKEGILIKPKMYMINDKPTCKGLRLNDKDDFMKILKDKRFNVTRFVKFKEANKRRLRYNEIIEFEKILDLEDNKRVWPSGFKHDELQDSISICLKI